MAVTLTEGKRNEFHSILGKRNLASPTLLDHWPYLHHRCGARLDLVRRSARRTRPRAATRWPLGRRPLSAPMSALQIFKRESRNLPFLGPCTKALEQA